MEQQTVDCITMLPETAGTSQRKRKANSSLTTKKKKVKKKAPKTVTLEMKDGSRGDSAD